MYCNYCDISCRNNFYLSVWFLYVPKPILLANIFQDMVFVLSESKCDSLGQQTEKNSRNTWNSQNVHFLLHLIVLLNKTDPEKVFSHCGQR